MHLTPVDNATALKLKGITVEFTTIDKKTMDVRLSDGTSTYIIRKAESYSECVNVYRADPFKMEKRVVVEGELDGFKVLKTFDHKYEAERFMAEFENDRAKGLKIAEREFQVEAGEIVPSKSLEDACPF